MKEHLAIDIDVEIYSIDDVNRAAYWFTDSCDVKLESGDGHTVRLLLWPRAVLDLANLERQLHTALLEERLRRVVEAETGEIRRRLWAAALREAMPKAENP